MSQNWDAFGDIVEGETGIFGQGDGLKNYEAIQHQYNKDGLLVQFGCESCNRPKHMTIEWPELVAIKFNVSPAEAYGGHPQLRNWASDWMNTAASAHLGVPYSWYPNGIRCSPGCGNPIRRPLIRPGECQGHLNEGFKRRFIAPQAIEGLNQQAQSVAMRLGRLG